MFKNGNQQNPSSDGPELKAPAVEPGANGGNANGNSIPAISLAKGGGAIRGIGEKFAANPVTGTGSMTVSLANSPGRSGFGPELNLSYDSGAGNGPFGFGWNLSLPAITRKTDKGLPRYRDAEESDVFLLSGAEDLVPAPFLDGRPVDDTSVPGYTISRYRPRIEALFARIERWKRNSDGDVHWRSISKDNLLTLYGKNEQARIADPRNSQRVFSWLICETRDDKGNAVIYEYKKEDSVNVDLSQAHERNRGDSQSQRRATNRYIKHVRYGNRIPLLDAQGNRPTFLTEESLRDADWMFEVVFDYGEGHYQELPLNAATPPAEQHRFVTASLSASSDWPTRHDPFSLYRSGFEVRNYRLCRRVLMFHHFPQELGTADCLVNDIEFSYDESSVASFVIAITRSGYVRRANGNYLKQSMPPLEFEYSKPVVQDDIHDLDARSLENLPAGLDGATYQWVDLNGEGLSGILTEQGNSWFYKPNLGEGRFGPLEVVASRPALANLRGGRQQLLDLAGDGHLDLVTLAGSTPGFYERTEDEKWEDFKPFVSLPNILWDEPNLRFVDLNGDGHADVLITEDQVFTWYPSLAEEGFGPLERVYQPGDEEESPRLVFADGTQSIYIADMCGDGLNDLVRIRNGEICYWPSCGYGRFGARITMDNSPWFDSPDQFSHSLIRLADIDGSGNNDLLYLHPDGVRIYTNESGNRWSAPRQLRSLPKVDNVSAVTTADLLGNGTACLIWSSPLPGAARRSLRYIDLMGGQKPHLLIKTRNNLGAETRIHYAPSTKFYLADKAAGKPWITRLPFPVHTVERVETYDFVSRNRFLTRYSYHHGYFDGAEREFRGFGMVEEFESEEFASLSSNDPLATATNLEAVSHVPPSLKKTWFHVGAYLGRDRLSKFFAGLLDDQDRGEYYREPAWRDDDVEAKKRLLDDTALPSGLTLEEEREACRALKGAILRQEIYALDGSDKAEHPYTVSEQNYTIELLQPRGNNRHAVLFTHPREAINYHYERNPADPRITHTLSLEIDDFGNVLKTASVGYGRRQPDPTLKLQADRDKQTQTLITYTENLVSNLIDQTDVHRTPLPCESRTYELTGYPLPANSDRFQISDFVKPDPNKPERLVHIFDSEIEYEQETGHGKQRRLIEQVRTLYRKNDLTALLPLRSVESLALPGESYKLAFTPGLLSQIFRSHGQPLIPVPANVLGGQGPDRGGYLLSQDATTAGLFPAADPANQWWIPSGRIFFSTNTDDSPAAELSAGRQHFFLPQRFSDAFGNTTTVRYDTHNLLLLETRDPLDNRVSVGERQANGEIDPRKLGNDYRVLQPTLVTDPNRNRVEVMFDALDLVVGTAVRGKDDTEGDSLDGFEPHLTQFQLDGFYDVVDPHDAATNLLAGATTRVVYDLFRFQRTCQLHPEDHRRWLPPYSATLARETHAMPAQAPRIQISFSYSDGFGRKIQEKIQAEPGPLISGGPVVRPRWVGSGWTIFNNKGKPVRQYEPFFSQLPEQRHQFEFGVQVGVSPILFYDPLERVVAKLLPNHSYEKVIFNPWQQTTYDVNDTVASDPGKDENVKAFFLNSDDSQRLPVEEYLPTWHALRTELQHAVAANERWPDQRDRDAERDAAIKAAIHKETPTITHFDTLGRPFLTIAQNKFDRQKPDGTIETVAEKYATRTDFDIEGNQRSVRDAVTRNNQLVDRVVMRYDYDMLGMRIHQASMEAGERWTLNDVTGKPVRAWNSRGHQLRIEYDPLRRPLNTFVIGADPLNPLQELLTECIVYGEQHPQDELLNLRGKVFMHFDQAGVAVNEANDFKGNLIRASRRLARDYRNAVNWNTVAAALPAPRTTKLQLAALQAVLLPLVESDIFTSRTSYDALNRPIQLIHPFSDQPGASREIIQPIYNDAYLLERVDVWLDHPTDPPGLIDEAIVPPANVGINNIDYDAKGQRLRIDYKNGTATQYFYDRETFRLVQLYTRRGATFTQDCDNPTPPPLTTAAPDSPLRNTACGLQSIHYAYDPVGNITRIRDDAQQTIYFNGQVVLPQSDYTYDASYRLIGAAGREHIGQVAQPETTWNDEFRVRLPHSSNGAAMRNYSERYRYDEAGNFAEVIHEAANGSWTRNYTYTEDSLIEPGKQSNRLTNTVVGTGVPEAYSYDAHGNMLGLSHLPLMLWNYRDQLQATAQQVVNSGTPETTWYVYDAAGQRARKITVSQAAAGQQPIRMRERIYLGGFEIYREFAADGETVALQRNTLHVMDDKQRIALVETRTIGNDAAPQQLIRYQFGNHLGSASVELDQQAQIISYEEYYSYGSTSYQAVRSQTETRKRYRFTGKERDEESGLSYHEARYYAPWLGRWTSCDPAGIKDGLNIYCYVRSRPITHIDPLGLQGFEHATEPKAAADIITGGFKPKAGASGYSWFQPEGQGTTGGPSMAGKTAILTVDIPSSPEATLPYKTHHDWFKQAEARLAKEGLTGKELQRAADAERWRLVGEYLKSEGKASYRIELGKGRGFFLALNERGLQGATITKLSGAGAGEVIAKLTLAGKAEQAAAAGAKAGLSTAAAARFGTTATVIKWAGRPLLVLAAVKDAYEIYRSENKARTITSVATGWAASWAGAKLGAAAGVSLGATIALGLGQAGPQIVLPEEVATVPLGSAIGGVVGGLAGGVGGYFGGRKVAEIVYDWTFEKGAPAQ